MHRKRIDEAQYLSTKQLTVKVVRVPFVQIEFRLVGSLIVRFTFPVDCDDIDDGGRHLAVCRKVWMPWEISRPRAVWKTLYLR